MKPADRARACQVAAVHLGWLTAEPWTRAATALATDLRRDPA